MQNDISVNENGETLNRNDGNGKREMKTETKTENAKHSYIPR